MFSSKFKRTSFRNYSLEFFQQSIKGKSWVPPEILIENPFRLFFTPDSCKSQYSKNCRYYWILSIVTLISLCTYKFDFLHQNFNQTFYNCKESFRLNCLLFYHCIKNLSIGIHKNCLFIVLPRKLNWCFFVTSNLIFSITFWNKNLNLLLEE